MDEIKPSDTQNATPNADDSVVAPSKVGFGHIGRIYAKMVAGKTRKPEATESRKCYEKPDKIGPDRIVELILSLAIVFFAYMQWSVAKDSSTSSEAQVSQLIDAAYRVDDAAESFSKSSADISRSMGDAVKKLGEQAKATRAANKIAEDAIRLEISGYNPSLEITGVSGYNVMFGRPFDVAGQTTNFFVTKDNISFQFYINNVSLGEATDVHYAVSKAHRFTLPRYAQSTPYEISRMLSSDSGLNKPVSIGNLEGRTKTTQPVVITATPGLDPQEMFHKDVAVWFYGELYWKSEIESTHGWKRVFCFLIKTGNGAETITPCEIPEEGVFPIEEDKKKTKRK